MPRIQSNEDANKGFHETALLVALGATFLGIGVGSTRFMKGVAREIGEETTKQAVKASEDINPADIAKKATEGIGLNLQVPKNLESSPTDQILKKLYGDNVSDLGDITDNLPISRPISNMGHEIGFINGKYAIGSRELTKDGAEVFKPYDGKKTLDVLNSNPDIKSFLTLSNNAREAIVDTDKAARTMYGAGGKLALYQEMNQYANSYDINISSDTLADITNHTFKSKEKELAKLGYSVQGDAKAMGDVFETRKVISEAQRNNEELGVILSPEDGNPYYAYDSDRYKFNRRSLSRERLPKDDRKDFSLEDLRMDEIYGAKPFSGEFKTQYSKQST